jgi:hypothetical protein
MCSNNEMDGHGNPRAEQDWGQDLSGLRNTLDLQATAEVLSPLLPHALSEEMIVIRYRLAAALVFFAVLSPCLTRAAEPDPLSHDGKTLTSGSNDGTIRFWDTATWEPLAVLHQGCNVYGLSFAPDDARLAAAGADNMIHLWDVPTRQHVVELAGHAAYVHQVVFSPDGTRLVSASGDFTVRVWDERSAQERTNQGSP